MDNIVITKNGIRHKDGKINKCSFAFDGKNSVILHRIESFDLKILECLESSAYGNHSQVWNYIKLTHNNKYYKEVVFIIVGNMKRYAEKSIATLNKASEKYAHDEKKIIRNRIKIEGIVKNYLSVVYNYPFIGMSHLFDGKTPTPPNKNGISILQQLKNNTKHKPMGVELMGESAYDIQKSLADSLSRRFRKDCREYIKNS